MQLIKLSESQKSPSSFPNPLGLVRRCGGYYRCPRTENGKRLGPLVGYAGRDESGQQYVGEIYVNFAKAERHSPVLRHVVERLSTDERFIKLNHEATGFCGAPEGGKALACQLAQENESQYIFPEKKVTAQATSTSRQQTKLVFDRHLPEEGEKWWIVEDVCNNFSTTAEMVAIIEEKGAEVAGILCFLNRSLTVDSEYSPHEGLLLPVISLVRKPIPEYTQDDPFVKDDIVAGNVIWKPKDDWTPLEQAMIRASFQNPA